MSINDVSVFSTSSERTTIVDMQGINPCTVRLKSFSPCFLSKTLNFPYQDFFAMLVISSI